MIKIDLPQLSIWFILLSRKDNKINCRGEVGGSAAQREAPSWYPEPILKRQVWTPIILVLWRWTQVGSWAFSHTSLEWLVGFRPLRNLASVFKRGGGQFLMNSYGNWPSTPTHTYLCTAHATALATTSPIEVNLDLGLYFNPFLFH